jgi:N-formylglutamate deformylase
LKRKNFCQLPVAPTTHFLPTDGIKTPIFIDLPHSGNIYPDDFNFSCPREILELCEEKYLEELFVDTVISKGGAVLKANFPRTYIDANRAINDIDQLLLDAPWTEPICENGRSIHGHGVVMRLLKGDPIYNSKLTHADIHHRTENYYIQYHNTLNDLSNQIHKQFNVVYHLNIHSMPSSVAKAHFPHNTPDFILGDLDGRSCGLDFRNHIAGFLKDMGYTVAINQLYKGAEIVRRYGQPAWGRHSLQVEINRSLFLNEDVNGKNKNFNTLKEDIKNLINQINVQISH